MLGSFSGLEAIGLYTVACSSCFVLHALSSPDAHVELVSIPPPFLFVDVRRRIELIQDFEMPTVCTTIKVSKDGQYILATGKHLWSYNSRVFYNRKCSGRKSSPPCLPQCKHFQTYRNTQKN